MQAAGQILNQMIQYFLMLLMGAGIVKAGVLKAEDSRVLSAVSVYLVVPCAILNAFQIEMSGETASGFLLAFEAAAVIHALLLVLTEILGRVFRLNEVQKVSFMYSNAGTLVIPLVLGTLGEEWLIYTSSFISVQTVLLWTHGKSLLCGERSVDLRKILCSMNVISIVTGIVLFILQIQFPPVIRGTLSAVGGMLGPVGMFVIGMLLTEEDLKQVFTNRGNYGVTALRLLFCPVFMLLVLRLTGAVSLHPQARTLFFISFLACAMPSAVSITQMAQVFGKDAAQAGAINIVSTLLCILTLPLMTALYWAAV